jgi:hypothetical protein
MMDIAARQLCAKSDQSVIQQSDMIFLQDVTSLRDQ